MTLRVTNAATIKGTYIPRVRHVRCGTEVEYRSQGTVTESGNSVTYTVTPADTNIWCPTCKRFITFLDIDPPGAVCLVAD